MPRTAWTTILPAWRLAHDTAITHGATAHQMAVLGAVLHQLASYQRLEDRLSLAELARHAGIWDGTDECPRSTRASVGRHLKALAQMGALGYRPFRARTGDGYTGGCYVRLYTSAVERASVDVEQAATCAVDRVSAKSTRAVDEPHTRAQDAPHARSTPSTCAPQARASEGFPEDVVRGEEPEGPTTARTRPADAGCPADADQAERPWWDDDDPDMTDAHPLSRIIYALAPDELGHPDLDAATAIDLHLGTHLTPGQRHTLATELTLDRPATVRHVLKHARHWADQLGIDLPRLDLPTRSSTR